MQQLEIQYFFPLTEQIPLDLDFTLVEEYFKSRLISKAFDGSYSNYVVNSGGLGGSGNVYASFIGATAITTIQLEPSKMTVKFDKPVPLYRRLLYKLLGWKVSGK